MRENRPIRWHHLAFLSQKEKGLKVILSFLHSLSCSSSISSLLLLCLSLLFFFVFLFSLIFAHSFVIHLVSELHGRWRDLYMMVFFFLGFFRISFLPILVFQWSSRHHFFCATVVPDILVAILCHDAMHQLRRGGTPTFVVASPIAALFWGLGHLGLFQP